MNHFGRSIGQRGLKIRIMQVNARKPVVVGVSGASGSLLASTTVDRLLEADVPVVMTVTAAARMVWREEMNESFGAVLERWMDYGTFTYCPIGDLSAPIASGTYPTRGMVVVPCSMATAAAVGHGFADNLLRRAADVPLKERRPMVVVPRETPLNTVHLENLTKLASMGVTVLPPNPAFYLNQKSVTDVIDFAVARTLVALNIYDALPDDMVYSEPVD